MNRVVSYVRSQWRQLRRPAGREFSWLTGGSQVEVLLSQLAVILVVRMASEDEAGQLFFALAITATIFMLIDPRLEDAIQRYVPKLREEDSDYKSFFWTLVLLDVAIGIVAIAIAVAVWISGAIQPTELVNPTFLMLSVVINGTVAALGSLNAGFATSSRLTSLAKVRAVLALLSAVLSIGGLLLGGVTGFLIGSALASLAAIVVTATYCAKLMSPRGYSIRQFRTQCPKGIVPFTIKSSLATSLATGGDSGVLAVAGTSGGPGLVVFLKLAMAPGRFLYTAFSAIPAQAFPRISNLAAKQDLAGVAGLCTNVTRNVAGPIGVATVLGALAMPLVLPLVYGSEYFSASVAAIIFLIAGGIRASVAWSKVLPLAIGRPALRLVAVAAEAAAMVLAAWIIPQVVPTVAASTASIAVVATLTMAILAFLWLRFLGSQMLVMQRRAPGID